MAQKKLLRFEAIRHFSNVLQRPEGMPGKWSAFFRNQGPITLELACGRGEYAYGLAKMNPGRNFVGVDIKGNRLYIGAAQSLRESLHNAAFLRTEINTLDRYFAAGEVDEIWITFPDPQLRTSRAKKRLTHPRFLDIYRKILRTGGRIHLKTDSPQLYHFTRYIIDRYDLPIYEATDDIYADPDRNPALDIKTHYEKLDIAGTRKICYCCFGVKPGPAFDEEGLQEELKQLEAKHQTANPALQS